MNNIFLTSQASCVLEKVCTFLDKQPSELEVVFIPTAAKPYAAAPWLEEDRAKLVELGFNVTVLDLDTASPEKTRESITNADIIFVGGGNTFYLLEKAKQTGFIEVTRKAVFEGKVYIGSSAGSVLAAPDIKYVELFDDPEKAALEDTKSLGLVRFSILPHVGNPKYADLHEKVFNEYNSIENPIVFVKDDEFVLANGDTWGVIEG